MRGVTTVVEHNNYVIMILTTIAVGTAITINLFIHNVISCRDFPSMLISLYSSI